MPSVSAKSAKVDEGDFSEFEAAITRSQQTVIAEMDRGSDELPAFLAHINRVIAALTGSPSDKDRSTFVGTYYLPFFAELKAKNLVEPFVYWTLQRAPVLGVREWISTHQTEMREFAAWSRNYAWPKPQ